MLNYTYDKDKILELIRKDFEGRFGLDVNEDGIKINFLEDGSIQFIGNSELSKEIPNGVPFISTTIESEMPELINWAIHNKQSLICSYNKQVTADTVEKVAYIFTPTELDGVFVTAEVLGETIDGHYNVTSFSHKDRYLAVPRMTKLAVANGNHFIDKENEYV